MAGRRTIVDWSPSAHAQLAHGPAILASFLGISSQSADSRGRQRADASNADVPFGYRPRVPNRFAAGGSADRYRGSADARGFLGGRLPHPRGRDRRQILHLIMNREPLAADLSGDGVARGWFRRRGKGQDFVFGLVHSLPWARRFAAWGGFAGHGADGVHRSRWTRLYLSLAPGGLSSRPVALPACPRSLSSAPDLVAPLVAPPFRRRAASMLVGERRRSVRLGATLFHPQQRR